ncbi:hypothetical protein F4782DRAFT_526610 [Xylaria castorea]|nr:hypothetical protein F4782DRAFT_526610 [Xylaria castorea]
MSSDNWERFKAIILHLYLLEKTPLHESQYEYQFKKWGVKKYAKKKDWKNLGHQLEKRAGKQPEVTRFGIPLSPGKVRRTTQRYKSIPTANEFGKRCKFDRKRYSDVMLRIS